MLASALFFSFISSTIDLHTLIPGNWTELLDNVSMVHEITLLDNASETAQFGGEYNGIDLLIALTSNTSGRASYGSLSVDFEFREETEELAIAEADASDGSHLSVLAYSDCTLEMSLFAKETRELVTLAFFKKQPEKSRWMEVVIPIGCAVLVVWAIKRYVPGVFS
jgi:hypothetical protein